MAKGRRGNNKNKKKKYQSNDSEQKIGTSNNPPKETSEPSKKKTLRKAKEANTESVSMKHRSQSFRSSLNFPVGKTMDSSNSGFLSSSSKNTKLSALQDRMRAKLEGSKFRMLNEKLYTTRGDEAFESFSKDPNLFDIYHRGYREQVEKWPENPLNLIIEWLKERHPDAIIADFGCGDAILSLKAPSKCKVHSFDLVSVNDRVIACDMAHVPLANDSIDIAIFCLSLMGTNLIDYLLEAKRVLKKTNGILKIAEVRSRIDGMEGGMSSFIAQICKLGFKCLHKDKRNKLFLLFEFAFNETRKENQNKEKPDFTVPPCIYKRR